MNTDLKKTIIKAQKAFKSIAKLEVDGNKLIARDITTNALLPFLHKGHHVDFVMLGKRDVVEIQELIR